LESVLFVFDLEGNLECINPAFLNLFHVPHLSHLNGLKKARVDLSDQLIFLFLKKTFPKRYQSAKKIPGRGRSVCRLKPD
jgi:hypothetical protein